MIVSAYQAGVLAYYGLAGTVSWLLACGYQLVEGDDIDSKKFILIDNDVGKVTYDL